MLGIIEELDDVKVAVGGFDELRLRPAAHFSDQAAGIYGHENKKNENGELKILGAGLASSFGESHFSLESTEVERLPFSVGTAVNTPYRHDAFQPLYLVSETLEQTIAEVLALTPERLLAL